MEGAPLVERLFAEAGGSILRRKKDGSIASFFLQTLFQLSRFVATRLLSHVRMGP